MHFCNPRQGYLENLKIVQVFPQDQLHFVYKQVNVSFDTLNFNFPEECNVEMKSALYKREFEVQGGFLKFGIKLFLKTQIEKHNMYLCHTSIDFCTKT